MRWNARLTRTIGAMAAILVAAVAASCATPEPEPTPTAEPQTAAEVPTRPPLASPDPAPEAPPEPPPAEPAAAGETYEVQEGDTLVTIAQDLYGDWAEWQRIYEANRETIGEDPDAIRIGMTLEIPPAESTE